MAGSQLPVDPVFSCHAFCHTQGRDILFAFPEDQGYQFYEELNGYSITVVITEPDASGNYELLEWKVSKLWNADDPVKDIWNGL